MSGSAEADNKQVVFRQNQSSKALVTYVYTVYMLNNTAMQTTTTVSQDIVEMQELQCPTLLA